MPTLGRASVSSFSDRGSHVPTFALSQPLFVFEGRVAAGGDCYGGGRAEDACRGADGYQRAVCGGAILSGGENGGGETDCGRDAGYGVARKPKRDSSLRSE